MSIVTVKHVPIDEPHYTLYPLYLWTWTNQSQPSTQYVVLINKNQFVTITANEKHQTVSKTFHETTKEAQEIFALLKEVQIQCRKEITQKSQHEFANFINYFGTRKYKLNINIDDVTGEIDGDVGYVIDTECTTKKSDPLSTIHAKINEIVKKALQPASGTTSSK